MQNKPNLLDAQMNVNSFHAGDYENKSNWKLGENKPNTKPIKPNFRKAKMNIALYPETNYERKGLYGCRKNKPNQTQFPRPTRRNKPNTNPNKANFKRYLAKMGHHELKYIDSLGQLTLNLIKDRKSN